MLLAAPGNAGPLDYFRWFFSAALAPVQRSERAVAADVSVEAESAQIAMVVCCHKARPQNGFI